MVALARRRRRCRPRPSGLVVVVLLLCGLTLMTGVVLLANAVAATPAGADAFAGAARAVGPPAPPAPDRAGRSIAVARAGLDPGAGPVEADAPAERVATTPASGTAWTWPVPGTPALLRGFDPPRSDWGRGHRGVDLAVAPGEQVRAAAAGVVSWSGRVAGRGVLTVTHDGGLRTTYEPIAAAAAVGTRVAAGAAIGVLETGSRHCAGRPCLHWGLLRGRTYLDPLSLLANGHPVLLPFWPPR